jgi:hypothetical protein
MKPMVYGYKGSYILSGVMHRVVPCQIGPSMPLVISDRVLRHPCRGLCVGVHQGLSNAAPVICFPGALIYSDVNLNFKKQIFLNNRMFQFFS